MEKTEGLVSGAAMRIHGEAQEVEHMRRAMNLEPWDEWAASILETERRALVGSSLVPEGRRSGRTTRMLCEALACALWSKPGNWGPRAAIVVVPTPRHVTMLHNMAKDIARQCRFTLPESFTTCAASCAQMYRGSRSRVYFDHTVSEDERREWAPVASLGTVAEQMSRATMCAAKPDEYSISVRNLPAEKDSMDSTLERIEQIAWLLEEGLISRDEAADIVIGSGLRKDGVTRLGQSTRARTVELGHRVGTRAVLALVNKHLHYDHLYNGGRWETWINNEHLEVRGECVKCGVRGVVHLLPRESLKKYVEDAVEAEMCDWRAHVCRKAERVGIIAQELPPCPDCPIEPGWYIGLNERKPCPTCRGGS